MTSTGDDLDIIERIMEAQHFERGNSYVPEGEFAMGDIRVKFHWVDGTDEMPWLRFVLPMPDNSAYARDLIYRVITGWVSEQTNNDACDISVREISAHHHLSDADARDVDEGYVALIASVEDWLS